MTGKIIQAISNELKALFDGTGVYVLRDTQFKTDNPPLHNMPCVVFAFNDSPDVVRFIGGAMRIDWDFNIKAFIYDFNSGLNEDEEYSANEYELIETITNHFNKKDWLSDAMKHIVENNCFNLMINGIVPRQILDSDSNGTIVGYGIQFNSVCQDNATSWRTFTDALSLIIKGGIVADFDITKCKWIDKCLDVLLDAEYIALTSQVVGNMYYISDIKKVKEVLTIDEDGNIITSKTIDLEKNDVFLIDTKTDYFYFFDGTDVVELSSINAIKN